MNKSVDRREGTALFFSFCMFSNNFLEGQKYEAYSDRH
jgi:hypothetical protein